MTEIDADERVKAIRSANVMDLYFIIEYGLTTYAKKKKLSEKKKTDLGFHTHAAAVFSICILTLIWPEND